MSFAKLAAAALVSPDEMEEQERGSRWGRVGKAALGLGALGGAVGLGVQHWDKIKGLVPNFTIGQAKGPINRVLGGLPGGGYRLPSFGAGVGLAAPALTSMVGKEMPGSSTFATSSLKRIMDNAHDMAAAPGKAMGEMDAKLKGTTFAQMMRDAVGGNPNSEIAQHFRQATAKNGKPGVDIQRGFSKQKHLKDLLEFYRTTGANTSVGGMTGRDFGTHLGAIRSAKSVPFWHWKRLGHGALGAIGGSAAQIGDNWMGSQGL